MSTKEDGGPAYPFSITPYDESIQYKGMTLRDYFAAKVMQSGCMVLADVSQDDAERVIDLIAKASYKVADAMIAERTK